MISLRRYDFPGRPRSGPDILASRNIWVRYPNGDGFTVDTGGFSLSGGSDGHVVATYGEADGSEANAYVSAR